MARSTPPFAAMRRAALFGSLWLLAAAAHAQTATPPLQLEASRDAGRIQLSIRTVVDAPHDVIWAVLTDYNNTAKWVPGMERSVVLARRTDGAIVEQSGRAEVLFFRLAINSVVDVQEIPPGRIEVKLVRGDFKVLNGAYELKRLGETGSRHELSWKGHLELAASVPGFVAQPLLANNLRKSFEGLVQEMERRAKATP